MKFLNLLKMLATIPVCCTWLFPIKDKKINPCCSNLEFLNDIEFNIIDKKLYFTFEEILNTKNEDYIILYNNKQNKLNELNNKIKIKQSRLYDFLEKGYDIKNIALELKELKYEYDEINSLHKLDFNCKIYSKKIFYEVNLGEYFFINKKAFIFLKGESINSVEYKDIKTFKESFYV